VLSNALTLVLYNAPAIPAARESASTNGTARVVALALPVLEHYWLRYNTGVPVYSGVLALVVL
jgi:hypothetical protein